MMTLTAETRRILTALQTEGPAAVSCFTQALQLQTVTHSGGEDHTDPFAVTRANFLVLKDDLVSKIEKLSTFHSLGETLVHGGKDVLEQLGQEISQLELNIFTGVDEAREAFLDIKSPTSNQEVFVELLDKAAKSISALGHAVLNLHAGPETVSDFLTSECSAFYAL